MCPDRGRRQYADEATPRVRVLAFVSIAGTLICYRPLGR